MSSNLDIKKRVITVGETMKVIKLKVKVGMMIYKGFILLIYESLTEEKNDQIKPKKMLKSTETGIIRSIKIKEGDIIVSGSEIIELEKECNHPTVIKDLCAECGADLQKENFKDEKQGTKASVSMIHMVPELKVNEEYAQILGKADMDRLLREQKLVLLVDLDQTLIHTTNDDIPNNIKDVYHFQLYGPKSPWYHTRLRPGTHNFLENISEKYELHICTFGSRRYAHTIARFLDPDGKFFSHRILSRDECFNANSKTANLKALFPCGENMVCIIDDREDVWDFTSNLIHVKPYHFFQHTGDIHAPPGLTKCENDDMKDGFDFSDMNSSESKNVDQKDDESNLVSLNNSDSLKDELKAEVSSNETINDTSSSNQLGELDRDKEDQEPSSTENTESKTSPSAVSDTAKRSNEKETMDGRNQIKTDTNDVDTESSVVRNSRKNKCTLNIAKTDADGNIIIEESDDYLLYLEEILKTIHRKYFEYYKKNDQVPDLKQIVPETRSQVLQGVSICFSGIVPNRIKLEESPAYKIARFLGAKVTQNIEPDTTHLVAVRAGTAKVHSVSKCRNIKLVTPEWLWTCAERWEKVDERLFVLKNTKSNVESRHPPAHCRSPDHPEQLSPITHHVTESESSSQSSGFLYTINPLMTFSSEDIESMEGEVDDIFKESDAEADSEADEIVYSHTSAEDHLLSAVITAKRKVEKDTESSSSSRNSVQDDDDRDSYTKKRMKRKRRKSSESPNNDLTKFNIIHNENTGLEVTGEDSEKNDDDTNSEDGTISGKFRRKDLPNEFDIEYNTEDGTEEDQESDGEWNVMGAALEREFLEDTKSI